MHFNFTPKRVLHFAVLACLSWGLATLLHQWLGEDNSAPFLTCSVVCTTLVVAMNNFFLGLLESIDGSNGERKAGDRDDGVKEIKEKRSQRGKKKRHTHTPQ